MYCLLLGKKPESYYASYRAWYKKNHGFDVETAALPFIAPSQSIFFYDPFSIDFDNPFDEQDMMWDGAGLDIQGSLKNKKGNLNFENFIKCLQGKSYSSLFTQENSKKFHFQNLEQKIQEVDGPAKDAPRVPKYPGEAIT